MSNKLSGDELHDRLDEEHTQALLTDYSGDYEVWLEEKVAALERELDAAVNMDLEVGIRQALEQRVEGLEDALVHCGYDASDCIDCGGPPHNEWCRFWKLRDYVPALFAFASQEEVRSSVEP